MLFVSCAIEQSPWKRNNSNCNSLCVEALLILAFESADGRDDQSNKPQGVNMFWRHLMRRKLACSGMFFGHVSKMKAGERNRKKWSKGFEVWPMGTTHPIKWRNRGEGYNGHLWVISPRITTSRRVSGIPSCLDPVSEWSSNSINLIALAMNTLSKRKLAVYFE